MFLNQWAFPLKTKESLCSVLSPKKEIKKMLCLNNETQKTIENFRFTDSCSVNSIHTLSEQPVCFSL